ncbi:hypothetical protein KIN20_013608 [Parelaphostrongylus tenuis]|uniref:Transposase n=1 Tax=Parelaphostrongylus tenuis TaxID=148309 RepID=A0AAD5MWD2_PARTN|nr:hypothetical protein KIN20_013608 [Parelaphostrongylus tenuis]
MDETNCRVDATKIQPFPMMTTNTIGGHVKIARKTNKSNFSHKRAWSGLDTIASSSRDILVD